MQFLPLLTILFIGLKLTHYIDWAWFWVLLPMLIPLFIVGIWFAVLLILSLVVVILEKKNVARRLRDRPSWSRKRPF